MREIREYNMNGTIILGVDNGYGNVKTAHRVFPTGIIKCDSEPVLSKEYIEYDGAYYIIGEGHKGFVADKQEDDDTYIRTLAAIAKELEARGLTEARIHLAVGLPLKWVQAQRDSFKQYLTRERYVSLKYRKVNYLIEIVDCTVMPQGYAAVAENLKDFKGMNLLVDIGNGSEHKFSGRQKMLYDIRTSEKAATTLETLTGVNRTIWLAEQYKNYGRIDYTYADDDVRNIITKHGGHYPDLNDLEMVVTHISTSSEKCRQIRQHGIVDLVKAYEFANSELRQFLENYEINIDIEACRLTYKKRVYDISYGKCPPHCDIEAHAAWSVGRKFYYDFTVCGFYQ